MTSRLSWHGSFAPITTTNCRGWNMLPLVPRLTCTRRTSCRSCRWGLHKCSAGRTSCGAPSRCRDHGASSYCREQEHPKHGLGIKPARLWSLILPPVYLYGVFWFFLPLVCFSAHTRARLSQLTWGYWPRLCPGGRSSDTRSPSDCCTHSAWSSLGAWGGRQQPPPPDVSPRGKSVLVGDKQTLRDRRKHLPAPSNNPPGVYQFNKMKCLLCVCRTCTNTRECQHACVWFQGKAQSARRVFLLFARSFLPQQLLITYTISPESRSHNSIKLIFF